jgi:hypothetical protein
MISPRPQEETDFSPGVNEHGLLLTLLLCSHLMSRMLSKFFAVAEWKRQKTFGSETFKRHSRDIQETFKPDLSENISHRDLGTSKLCWWFLKCAAQASWCCSSSSQVSLIVTIV